MLCVNHTGLFRKCTPTSGGISRLLIFDPSDFNFTQDTKTNSYTAITRRTKAGDETDLGYFFDIPFKRKEAERTYSQSVGNSGATKYTHTVTALIPMLGQDLTNFLSSLDAASYCCGLGLIIEHNDGKVFVMGEKYVDDETIPVFWIEHNGTEGGTGKLFDDPNSATVKFVGDYSRELNEFKGGIDAILEMMAKRT
ncbi:MULTISPECIES: hypothetical protein [Apibacter]|uniref:hypothetical protein n=1 Tax=Apibacter TaxID=1778601 RepID=UPI00135D2E96|nr:MULTISPECIES: hypothetical protein [Apibacter]MXP04786.1 hypothetical protein [Apibacter sp. B3546]MXP13127.1 hypothetical protein [Apibacter sp. B3239]